MATNGKSNGAPAVNGLAYPIEDHTYDVVVVGPARAGCAPWSAARSRLRTACITKVFPTRAQQVAAQGGIAAALETWRGRWRWHMYDTVKGAIGWATRTHRIHVPQCAERSV